MSITYTPTTNFGSKDVLPANDPNKVIVGAEFTSEFNAIQAAFALAAPTSNPTFSGTATYNNLNVTGTSTLGVLNAGTTTVGTFTSTGIDDNATSTAITIDAAENVGIGQSNPTRKLWVEQTDGVNNINGVFKTNSPVDSVIAFSDGNSTNGDFGVRCGANGDNFSIFTNGANERLTVDALGNVGIGTDNPKTNLDVVGATGIYQRHSSGGRIVLDDVDTADTSNPMSFISNASGTLSIGNADRNPSTGLTTNSSTSMTVTASGRVGIGNTNPTSKLTIGDGTADAAIQFPCATKNNFIGYDGSFDGLQLATNGEIKFQAGTSYTERMRLDANGNLGIGTDNPQSAKLEINDASPNVSIVGSTRSLLYLTDAPGTTPFFLRYNAGSSLGEMSAPGGDLSFRVGAGSTGTERMRIDALGNVGIGTDSPDAELTVHNNISMGDGTSVTQLAMKRNTANYIAATDPAGYLVFRTGGTDERMRIDPIGRVGIGASNPVAKLQQYEASGTSHWLLDGNVSTSVPYGGYVKGYSTAGQGGRLELGTVDNSAESTAMTILETGYVGIGTAAPTQPLTIEDAGAGLTSAISLTNTNSSSNTRGGTLVYNVSNGTTQKDAAFIQGGKTGNTTGGFVSISTADASWNTPVERMRIDASGNLLVGATIAPGNGQAVAGAALTKNPTNVGQLRLGKTASGTYTMLANYHNGVFVGGINVSDTVTAIVASSDERLKDNIVDAPAGNIEDIKVRSFDWKSTGEHQEYGVIAQELNEVAPYAVHHNAEEDHWGVDYAALVPMLVKEIQDLKAEVEALKNA